MVPVALVATVIAAGCGSDPVPIATKASGSDYGRAALLEAIGAFGNSDRSPQAYRQLTLSIAKLRPQFDDEVSALAERNLVFLALAPLESVMDDPPPVRRDALGLTVWPTALGVEPAAGESAEAYTERVCGDALALDCKYTVPAYRPLILSALVWNRLKARAREALATCDACAGNPGYADAVARYEARERALSALAGDAETLAHPKHWPVAGDNAGPWPPAPAGASTPAPKTPELAFADSGEVTLAGAPVAAGKSREALSAARGGAQVLAVSMAASATVANLRPIAADAAAAGFDELAVLVHARSYPFARRAYRIALRRRDAVRVRVRDVDSIQVLVQALDAHAAAGAPALALR